MDRTSFFGTKNTPALSRARVAVFQDVNRSKSSLCKSTVTRGWLTQPHTPILPPCFQRERKSPNASWRRKGMFDNVFIFDNSFFNFYFVVVFFLIWGLHANQKILRRFIHVIKNRLVPSQFFIPSWKELFLLGFKGGPNSFIYFSTPASFHPLPLTILSIHWRAAAVCMKDSKPLPTHKHPQQHPQLHGTGVWCLAEESQKRSFLQRGWTSSLDVGDWDV